MKNKTIEKAIHDHYRQADLDEKIKAAFERAGREITDYTDTESVDEFHIRGRLATRELARLADLRTGMKVIDLGCGIGGPARMLAAEFGCMVTGIDLVPEYCRAAEMITQQAGLSHKVNFRQGDMVSMPFEDESFDAAWTLHTIMNIEDKTSLFGSVFRVLKPGGIFALYEICKGRNSPPVFPVPWAGDASMSFLLGSDDLRRELSRNGFQELQWQDVSSSGIKWFETIAASVKSSGTKTGGRQTKATGPRPGISLLLGKTAAEKSRNVFNNLSEDRIRIVYGVFQKPF